MRGLVTELEIMRLEAQGCRPNGGTPSPQELQQQINRLARCVRFLLKLEQQRQQEAGNAAESQIDG